MAATEDHTLIRQMRKGDKRAFEQLVQKHYPNIYAYCYRRTGDEQLAADLTQEVFLKLVSSIDRYRFFGKFKNFLFTIAVNTCNDYFRKTKPTPTNEIDELSENDDPAMDAVIQSEETHRLHTRLKNLPDPQREAIILYYYHGFKMKDIAQITGAPLGTVKSRIKQGLDKLRKSYQGDD